MKPSLGKLSYKLITASLRMPVFTLLREFEQAEKMSRDQLRTYQWLKLRRLIKHAVSFSPYYRRLFSEIGAEPDDIRDEDSFNKIPVLTKSIIREFATDILVSPHPLLLNEAKIPVQQGIP